MSCLYYYKLVSDYECDVSKQCKLTVNEIDHNFYSLKSDDIKSAELDEASKSVILTRNNGDRLVVDLTPILSGAIYDLKVVYENPSEDPTQSGASVINISYSTLNENDEKIETVIPITGLVTTDNINTILGDKLMTRVISDNTLIGDGTIKSPLGLSDTEKNTPAIRLIDKTIGEELPENPSIHDKYVTKEKVNDFGLLYNYKAIEKIINKLNEDGSEWRVPSKSDWDCLLNSIEPCEYRNHESTDCHKMLGKYAGEKLKSTCGWDGQEKCECKNTSPFSGNFCDDEGNSIESGETNDSEPTVIEDIECSGTDDFGMRVLPTGYKNEYDSEVKQIGKSTAFWTSSHVYDDVEQDIYIKKFDYDKCGVIQEAQCPDDFYSLRLVKNYDGENYHDSEVIDGFTYKTILFPDCEQIWTESNFSNDYSDNVLPSSLETERIVHYINSWNGKYWEKRLLTEGETVVIMDGNEHCQYNIEYRVFLESSETSCNNQILVNTDEAVAERVLHVLSGMIEDEREERISADTALQEAIDNEVSRATSAETVLDEKIEQEIQDRKDDVDAEEARATSAETVLNEKIEQEISDRIADVNEEENRAISAETALDEKIEQEISDRIADVNEEENRATSAETVLDEKIEQEIQDRKDDVDSEEARATERENEIDGQLLDWAQTPFTLSASSDGEYNLVIPTKDGIEDHSIKIILDSNFGEI